MLTLQELLNGVKCLDENTLAELSDKLWELGTLDDIKEKVTPELFTLHICMNMVGNWQCDGWWYYRSKISRNYWLFEPKYRNNAEITYTQRLQIASYFP